MGLYVTIAATTVVVLILLLVLFAATKINKRRSVNSQDQGTNIDTPRQHEQAIIVVQTEEVNVVHMHVHSDASIQAEVNPPTAKNKAYGMSNSTSDYTYYYANDASSCNDVPTTVDEAGSTTDPHHNNTKEIKMTINEAYLHVPTMS